MSVLTDNLGRLVGGRREALVQPDARTAALSAAPRTATHEDLRAALRQAQRNLATDAHRGLDGLNGLDRTRQPGSARNGLFTPCANPGCDSGWLKLWRSRSAPIFEGGWTCSPDCTAARVALGLRREIEARGNIEETHRHRIPLGLVMLEQGWITGSQLRGAIEAQRSAGGGRLGHWLVRQQGVSELLVTRALSLQWSAPVLSLDFHDAEGLSVLLPRLFVDAFGALPLRVAAGKILYLGFEARLDPVLSLAVERMTGLRVESGLVQESLFRPAHARMLRTQFPAVELMETSSEAALVKAMTRHIEKVRPVETRLVRTHDCLWLRTWLRPQSGPLPEPGSIQDLLCSIRPH